MFERPESASPIQLYQFDAAGLRCQCTSPAENLAEYIHYYWLMDVDAGQQTLEVIPDNAADLVMSPGLTDFSVFYLPAAERFTIPLSGPIRYAGISFRIEKAANFFGCDIAKIANLAAGCETTEFLGAASLIEAIRDADSITQLAQNLDIACQQRITGDTTETPAQPASHCAGFKLSAALDALQSSIGAQKMQQLAAGFDLSERQFRRTMTSVFGFGPKKIQRVMRLQSALFSLLKPDRLDIDEGYYDDAHRIKEIRELTGMTPGQIREMAEIYNSKS